MNQFQEELPTHRNGENNTLGYRIARRIHGRFPRLYRVGTRVTNYARGPRPRNNGQMPVGLLDRTWQIKGKTLDVYWEKYILHFTHVFRKPWILWPLVVAYIISLAFFGRANYFFTPEKNFIDCTAAYWSALDGCGLDGSTCAPFTNRTFEFRCPAGCKNTVLANPRTVGDQEVVHVPLIVGGGDTSTTYRGDSFVCAAGIHAGLISDSRGGCGTVTLVGSFTNYLSSNAHGLSSTAFPSVFPSSYRITPATTLTHCTDLRNEALAFNIIITCMLFLLLRPKPIVLFWSLVCIGYWHITLFSDPASVPPKISTAFETFLPSLFICYAFWRVAFRHVLPAFSELPLERVVWYLPAFWAGVLFNLVVSGIPIDRLVASDITERPGAMVALIVCCLVVLALTINQIRVIRKTGWLLHYLKWYILGALTLVVLALLPGLQFRLHHWFAALLIIPLTAFPTRLSSIYQAFCLGMFLNGAAKFGLDSILQTADELRRDAPLGSDLPSFLTTSATWNTSIPLTSQTLQWQGFPNGSSWDSYALLVDDVLRYVGRNTTYLLSNLDPSIPHFFRLAYQKEGASGDFTKAAVWRPNGQWVDPGSGPS
ncbi:hypothetical protein CPB86DRAFT_760022 [Serendipita vermifera]|nr:hypothetical protein CPB86DRAFT_760022 [Serendipita vermifera]